ncbi:hypothetical protein lerEdw1_004788 [Lerista edwardsae]|nr:hypothetical protein lerEdw1_004788 [Lerista edwardsae]
MWPASCEQIEVHCLYEALVSLHNHPDRFLPGAERLRDSHPEGLSELPVARTMCQLSELQDPHQAHIQDLLPNSDCPGMAMLSRLHRKQLRGCKRDLATTGNEPSEPPSLPNPDIKTIWRRAAQRSLEVQSFGTVSGEAKNVPSQLGVESPLRLASK